MKGNATVVQLYIAILCLTSSYNLKYIRLLALRSDATKVMLFNVDKELLFLKQEQKNMQYLDKYKYSLKSL